MTRRLVTALALSVAFAGAAAAQDVRRDGDTLGFKLQASIIFVEGTINGSEPLIFIFDTGASVTVLRPQTAEKLGLTKKGEKPKGGGILAMPTFVTVDSFALGKAKVSKLPVAVMTAPQAELPLTMQGIKYDGIVGYNFISQFVTTIDYRKKTIQLVPNDYTPEDPTEALKSQIAATRAAKGVTAGFMPATITADQANELGVDGGVVVKRLAKEGPAEKGGLKVGDVIQEVNGKRVATVDEYKKILQSVKPGDVVKFKVIRDKKDVEVDVTVAERK